MYSKHIGIDYGSKLAGTTSICYKSNNEINLLISDKKQDADEFITRFLLDNEIDYVFIDAPLSLPLAYYDKKHSDYFYRKCDKESKAMSPMFLGGLTARAMRLKNTHSNIEFIETYPKLLAQEIDIMNYKKNKLIFVNSINEYFNLTLKEPKTWHEVDSILAYLSGERYLNNVHHSFGDTNEGIIIF